MINYYKNIEWLGGFRKKKKIRTHRYMKFIYKRKLIVCPSCNGTGYYDHNNNPSCGFCEGSGKVRESKY